MWTKRWYFDGKCTCIICDRTLEAEPMDGLTITGVYDGLIFRATGNFGSTIFDPMPTQREEVLQVIICDECIKRKIEYVTLIRTVQRSAITFYKAGPFEIGEKEDV